MGGKMGAKKKTSIPEDRVALYEKAVAAVPEIERKGANNPYTSINGNMFSILLGPQGRMGLRLPTEAREAFLKKYKTGLFEAYGAVMPEYVAVPEALFKKTTELQKHFRVSYEYARTLRAKPSKKKG
jgi:hypothetical protein